MIRKSISRLVSFTSLRGKILLNQLAFTLIPFILISVFLYFYMQQSITRKYSYDLNEKANSCVNLINKEIVTYINRSILLMNDSDLAAVIRKAERTQDIKELVDFQKLVGKYVFDLEMLNSNINQFILYFDNYSGPTGKYIRQLEQFEDQKLMETIRRSTVNDVIWSGTVRGEGDNAHITFYKNIVYVRKAYGILEVNIPLRILAYYMDNMGFPPYAIVTFTDGSGRTIYVKSGQNAGNVGISRENMSRFMMVRNTSELINKGTMIAAIPKSHINSEYGKGLLAILLGFFGLLTVIVVVSRTTSDRITKRLEHFMNYIRESDIMLLGDTAVDIEGTDEIAIIKQKFVDIIRRMNEAFKDLLEARNKNNLLQLELLQARINPHLLYNSLSVINWYALRRNDQQTADIVNALIRYYRIALNHGESIIKVSEELDMIREYIRIINLTEEDRYELNIDVSAEITDYCVLLHLLQPVVENSVIHGLRKAAGKKLLIKGHMESGDIVFEISDNGCGMDLETIESVLSLNYSSGRRGYGIKNLIKRISFYYGNGYGVDINSTPGEGTRVNIRVRAVREECMI